MPSPSAFFAAYMLPQMNGLLVGFGTGNIFRRLNREAPMGCDPPIHQRHDERTLPWHARIRT